MADAIDRLKNRARTTVPARDSSLVKAQKDELTESSHSVDEQSSQAVLADLQPEPTYELPEVTRRTVRLEKDVDDRLESLCSQERITRDTFIEAAYLACANDPALMQLVVAQAKARYLERKRAGDQRKFATMAKKYTANE